METNRIYPLVACLTWRNEFNDDNDLHFQTFSLL